MSEKQWSFVYSKIKEYLKPHIGKVPDENTSEAVMSLYKYLSDSTEKSRAADPKIDQEIQNIMGIVFKIVHSLEKEGREL
jgi:hypothetical protein